MSLNDPLRSIDRWAGGSSYIKANPWLYSVHHVILYVLVLMNDDHLPISASFFHGPVLRTTTICQSQHSAAFFHGPESSLIQDIVGSCCVDVTSFTVSQMEILLFINLVIFTTDKLTRYSPNIFHGHSGNYRIYNFLSTVLVLDYDCRTYCV